MKKSYMNYTMTLKGAVRKFRKSKNEIKAQVRGEHEIGKDEKCTIIE